jgi:hypothetical protein
MRLSVLLASVAAIICVPVSVVGRPLPDLGQRLFSMTPEQFERSATVKDDELEVEATITTQRGFKKNFGIEWLGRNDCFLRAFVDKKTGVARYQLYAIIADRESDRDRYQLVNYETPAGPKTAELLRLGRTKDCLLRNLMGQCTYTEDVALPVDEALLTQLAARYAPGQRAAWYFRFKAQSGVQYTDGLAAAEIAGLLAAVATYRRDHHLPASPMGSAPATPVSGR